MAAIFQIRRGDSSNTSSLQNGELYLNTAEHSLQVGTSSNPVKLLSLNTASFGNVNLTGNLTASNAYFSGDVAISGNLFLGNSSSDNISALGVFTSDLSAGTTNVYNIGSTTSVWKNVYATSFSGSFSGSINGVNEGIATFSASVDNRLDQLQLASASLQSFTSSQEAKNVTIGEHTSSINSFTQSQESKDIVISAYTASMNTFSASIYQHSASINSFTSSQEAKDITIGAYTSSMNLYTSSVNEHISDINTYTASLRTAIDVTGGNTRIIGNLIVDGTQTSLNVNNVYVEDKLITLSSGSLSSATSDGSGFEVAGANVSMSWEHTNTRFAINTNVGIIGSISASTVVGLNGDSVTVYSTSVDSRLSNLQSKSASVDNSILLLGQFTQSQHSKNSTLATYTSSVNSDLTSIHQTTSSLNTFTASIFGTNEFTASTKIRLDNLENTSASVSSSIGQLNSVSASLLAYTSSANAWSGGINNKLIALEAISASHSASINQINSVTASLNLWTGSGFFNGYSTSVDSRILTLSASVAYINTVAFGGIDLNSKFTNIELFTASANSRLNSIEAATSSYETNGRGIVSGSSQITPLLPTGVISGSSQITLILPTGTVSGSSQVSYTGLSNIPANIVSGSSQILGGSTIHSGSSGDYQFNSIGVGAAASTTTGEIRAIGDITAYYSSDIRLKENIVPIVNALTKVNQISGNTYDWKEGYEEIHSHKGNDVGVIAQEIEEILPQIVTNRDNGYKAVQYEKIIPLLIEAIKELSVKIKELENK